MRSRKKKYHLSTKQISRLSRSVKRLLPLSRRSSFRDRREAASLKINYANQISEPHKNTIDI